MIVSYTITKLSTSWKQKRPLFLKKKHSCGLNTIVLQLLCYMARYHWNTIPFATKRNAEKKLYLWFFFFLLWLVPLLRWCFHCSCDIKNHALCKSACDNKYVEDSSINLLLFWRIILSSFPTFFVTFHIWSSYCFVTRTKKWLRRCCHIVLYLCSMCDSV